MHKIGRRGAMLTGDSIARKLPSVLTQGLTANAIATVFCRSGYYRQMATTLSDEERLEAT